MSSSFNVRRYGAIGNGIVDDSAAIRLAIAAAVADGGGAVFFPNGTYLVSGEGVNAWCIDIPSNIRMIGQSREATIIKMADNQLNFVRPFSMYGSDDVWVLNLTIDGNKSGQSVEEHRAGVFANTSKRLTIGNLTSINNSGDGIDIHAGCEDVIIYNCLCEDNDRSGVALNGGTQKRITIRNCQLINNEAQQVDTEVDAGNTVTDITVEDCYLVSGTDYALTMSGHDGNFVSKGFYINNNIIEGPIFAVWAGDIRFTNNKVTTRADDTAPPFVLFRRSDAYIAGNIFTANNMGYGESAAACVFFQGVDSATDRPSGQVINNILIQNTTDTAADGLVFNNHIDAVVSGNHIIGNATSVTGIECRVTAGQATESLIIKDNILESFEFGVRLFGAVGTEEITDVTIVGNIFQQSLVSEMNGMDLDADGFGIAKNVAVYGNQLKTSNGDMFVGATGGFPSTAMLIGGNRGDRGIYSGVGSPQGALVENIGALYMDRAGTAYLKTADNGANTGWAAITHA